MTELLLDIEPPNGKELGEYLRKVFEAEAEPRPRAVGPCTRYTDRDGKVSCWHSKDDYDWWIVASGSGFRVTTIQGSYTTANADSANTHAKGGAKDIELDGTAYARCLEECRRARDRGLLAWPRFWKDNWHAHVVDPMCPNMAPELAAQVVLFGRGYDGLVGNNPDPLGGYKQDLIMSLYAKRYSTVITPPVTASNTVTTVSRRPEPNILGGSTEIVARTKPAVAGIHSWEYTPDGGNTAVKFTPTETLGASPGTTVAANRFSEENIFIRAKFAPTDKSKYQGSVSDWVRVTNILPTNLVLRSEFDVLVARVTKLEGGTPSPPEPVPGYGFDVSGHQTLDQVRAAAADPKTSLIICKATQGTKYVSGDDPNSASAWPDTKIAAGDKYAGAYHYCEEGHDAIVEADHFLATAQPASGQIVVLDYERPVTPEFLLAWLDYVALKTKATPLVYSNWRWIKGSGLTAGEPGFGGIRAACTVEQWERLVKYPAFLAENAEPGKFSTIDPKPGSSMPWPVLVHQYKVGPYAGGDIDFDYVPDMTALRKLAIP